MTRKRVYYLLANKVARSGYNTPVDVLLEADDVVKEVRRLEKLLGLPEDPNIRKLG